MSFPFYAIFPTQISKKYSIVLCYDDDGDKIMMMTIDDFRSVLEYNVATMCPNQTCEPVEFLQVRICLQVNLVPKIYFPPGGWPEGGFPHQERERWSKSGKHWCCWGGRVSLIVCHCVLHGR